MFKYAEPKSPDEEACLRYIMYRTGIAKGGGVINRCMMNRNRHRRGRV